jgi:hypothetical protein
MVAPVLLRKPSSVLFAVTCASAGTASLPFFRNTIRKPCTALMNHQLICLLSLVTTTRRRLSLLWGNWCVKLLKLGISPLLPPPAQPNRQQVVCLLSLGPMLGSAWWRKSFSFNEPPRGRQVDCLLSLVTRLGRGGSLPARPINQEVVYLLSFVSI